MHSPTKKDTQELENNARSTELSSCIRFKTTSSPPAPSWSKFHNVAFIICVCAAQLLAICGLAQTIAPLYIIGDDLKIQHPGQLSWFTAAYSMTLGTFIMPSGRIGDIFGHKRVFIFGWLWFATFSFLTGSSREWGAVGFSVMRGLQGIGPALTVPNAMALIGRNYPLPQRGFVFSLFGACGPIGYLAGGFFSSLLAQRTSWPWSFWALGVVCLLVASFTYCIVPESPTDGNIGLNGPKPRFDWLGTATGLPGLLLINFSLNQAPLVGWHTPYVYSLLIIGITLTGFFILVQFKLTDQPLIPIRGLQPQAILALACVAAGWASHGIWIYYLVSIEQRIRGQSALLTTASLVPVAPVGLAFALSTGPLISRFGVARVMLSAMICFLIGSALLATVPAHQIYWGQTFFSILVMPGGMNLSFPAATILLSGAMAKEHQGKAASLVSTVINYSIASGLGIAGSVESSINKDGSRLMEGYHGAMYLGVGLTTFGVFIGLYFCWSLRKKN